MKKKWKEVSRRYEADPRQGTSYKSDRFEGYEGPFPDFDVGFLHQQPFIRKVIPELINKKNDGKKVHILELGSGAGIFAEQIRQAFEDRVEVYTTGLKKKAAQQSRTAHGTQNIPYLSELPKKLKKQDLKWRSISELRDFQEFDLIIDTIGEAEYRKDLFNEYFDHVAAKLLPGGEAFIVLFYRTEAYQAVLDAVDRLKGDDVIVEATIDKTLLRVHIVKKAKQDM